MKSSEIDSSTRTFVYINISKSVKRFLRNKSTYFQERATIIRVYFVMWIVFFLLSIFTFFLNAPHYSAGAICLELFYISKYIVMNKLLFYKISPLKKPAIPVYSLIIFFTFHSFARFLWTIFLKSVVFETKTKISLYSYLNIAWCSNVPILYIFDY